MSVLDQTALCTLQQRKPTRGSALSLRRLVTSLALRLWPCRRRLMLLFAYLTCEVLCLQRFRARLMRLRQPRRAERRGTLEDLRWLLRGVQEPRGPATMGKASVQRYLDEQPDMRGSVTWEHYYVMVQNAFCISGPSPEEHGLLVQIASTYAKQQGLPQPPPAARLPTCKAPVGFGQSTVQVVYKPLALELVLSTARLLADATFRAAGYRGRWVPTPEGLIRCWTARPRQADPKLLPAVFIHGVGFGAVPYFLFLERLRAGRQAPLLVLELPNCSRCHFQPTMPSAAHFREALERLLQEELGISEPGKYALLGHSLGTIFCSMVMNDPRLEHADAPLRPARLVLLDPICFAQELAEAHRLPFWSLREAITGSWWRWPLQLAVLLLIIRDEYTQEATKRAIVPGTDALFRCRPALLQKCQTLVCLCGNDQALPAWRIRDYVRVHFPEVELRMDPGLEHGGFLTPFLPTWLAQCHAGEVLRFLGGRSVPRVASLPGASAKEAGASKLRASFSEHALSPNGLRQVSSSARPR